MSRVTNLIITCSKLENEEKLISELKGFKTYSGSDFFIVSVNDQALPPDWYGGSKRLECIMLIGAYNHLDLVSLLSFLRSEVKWEAADLVQLIVKEQDEFKFKLIDLMDE